jgi:hypothetical protein
MKIPTFILGLALGYVVGTRQGREGYDRLKRRATGLWQSPQVRSAVRDVQGSVGDKSPAASRAINKVIDKADELATASTPAEELPGNV